jgi:hypothetical protein
MYNQNKGGSFGSFNNKTPLAGERTDKPGGSPGKDFKKEALKLPAIGAR